MLERKTEETTQTTIKLNLKKFEQKYAHAFYEFVQKCKEPSHKMVGKTQAIAMEFNLITENGEIDAAVRGIILLNVSSNVLEEEKMLTAMLLSSEEIKYSSKQLNDAPEQVDQSLIKAFIKIVNIQREEGIRGDVPGIGLFGSRAAYNGNLMLYKYLDSESLKIIEEAKGYSPISRSSISIQDDVVSINLSGRYVTLDDEREIVARIPLAELMEICQKARLQSAEEELLQLCFFGNDINRVKQILALPTINVNKQFETKIKGAIIFGDTFLILAAKRGHTEIVHFLLERKADKSIANYFGQTAVSVASSTKIKELIDSWVPRIKLNL